MVATASESLICERGPDGSRQVQRLSSRPYRRGDRRIHRRADQRLQAPAKLSFLQRDFFENFSCAFVAARQNECAATQRTGSEHFPSKNM
jgi:hypothetical protein